MAHSRTLVGFLALPLLLSPGVGCGDDPTPAPADRAQQSTASAPATSPLPASPATQPTAAEAGPIRWWIPADWERVPGERPMRVATFRRAGGAPNEEIVVSQFPGDVGGTLANVNRWRAQIGLAAITEAELPAQLRPFDNGTLKGHTMRLRGEKQHLLAAIISDPAAARTWFVKAVTTPTAADTLEADLNAFATSFGTGRRPDGERK